ncbi:hypothetical protein [Streptomyces sp. NPDC058228]|uniref:hypothetical protein n=1 Tax=Streptomyces sp. NPDC058228 TaxID=3346390 RepID=UPI0036E8C1CD
MKHRGVVYDVGLKFMPDGFSVEPFDPALVNHDMQVIANDLHANAVRVEGEEIERLLIGARAAHAAGLTVFFNPWKMNAGVEETRAYFAEAAVAAEQLRSEGVDIVFVAGCEYTIFSDGIFPGATWAERGAWLGAQLGGDHMPGSPASLPETLRQKSAELNEALRSFAETIRSTFGGPLTYSAGSWEGVDWSIFDIVGVDYYRRGESEKEYIAGLEHHRHGKPLAVMEMGCCAYEGAAVRGDAGFAVLQGVGPDGSGIFEGEVVPTRSEREQADYVGRQLELLADADVYAVFVFEFSFPSMRTGEGAKDLDMVNFAIVKTYGWDDPRAQAVPNWEPKEAFERVAQVFGRLAAAAGPDR